MTRQAITISSLKDKVYSHDFYKYSNLAVEGEQSRILQSAFDKSLKSEQIFDVVKISKNKKTCYSVKDYSDILLCRNISDNIKNVINAAKGRVKIQRQLIQHLKEGTFYRIYRLDIKSFYESINYETIVSALDNSPLSSQTKNLILSFINSACGGASHFIPRGIQFSPALAELILQNFDNKIRLLDEVFYFARYVDDIIIITSGIEESRLFLKKVKSHLPKCLSLNYNKQRIIDVTTTGHSGNLVARFEYLGYRYNIFDPNVAKKIRSSIFRTVNVTLSKSKVSKIKTRISRSFEQFRRDNDFDILRDRIQYLTSNRLMKDKKSNRIINTGIYYNNVNLEAGDLNLQNLDNYLFARIHKDPRFNVILDNDMKRTLSTFSFVRGYTSRNFKRFSPNKLARIKDSWRH